MTTFVTLRGQFDNIGDVILRRQLGRWIPGPSVAYVGSASAEFIDALQLSTDCAVERSFSAFARSLASSPRGSSYVFKPGETQLAIGGMKENVGLLPLLARLRLRDGQNVRVGVGARGSSQFYAKLCQPSVRLSTMNLWRDEHTLRMLGTGQVMPDLAFAEGSDSSDWLATRDLLAVSLRGDKDVPSDSWLTAISDFANQQSLRVVAISQVRRDDCRTRFLAKKLKADAIICGSRPSLEIEDELRQVYRRTSLTVSDRLHVLIAALTEGSPVSACVPAGSRKIADHLAVVGLVDVAIDADTLSTDDCVATFVSATRLQQDISKIVVPARSALLNVRKQVIKLLTADQTQGNAHSGIGS